MIETGSTCVCLDRGSEIEYDTQSRDSAASRTGRTRSSSRRFTVRDIRQADSDTALMQRHSATSQETNVFRMSHRRSEAVHNGMGAPPDLKLCGRCHEHKSHDPTCICRLQIVTSADPGSLQQPNCASGKIALGRQVTDNGHNCEGSGCSQCSTLRACGAELNALNPDRQPGLQPGLLRHVVDVQNTRRPEAETSLALLPATRYGSSNHVM